MLGFPMGLGMAPELHPDVSRVWKFFQKTYFTMLNNMSFMKHALKSVPGFADVGVPHGVGDDTRTALRCLEGLEMFSNDLFYYA